MSIKKYRGGKKKHKSPKKGQPKQGKPKRVRKVTVKKKKGPKTSYTIRQPRKKRASVNVPKQVNVPKKVKKSALRAAHDDLRQALMEFSMDDTSSYSNIQGKENYKRKMRQKKSVDGQESGIIYDQDNDKIIIQQYPN